VGRQLTALDQTRAFCVSLSAAITVIAASAMALPVSSTHIAIGAVFGVGFYREFRKNSELRSRAASVAFAGSNGNEERPAGLCKVSQIPPYQPRKLVRRSELLTIAAAWFITVPCAGLVAAICFFASHALFAG